MLQKKIPLSLGNLPCRRATRASNAFGLLSTHLGRCHPWCKIQWSSPCVFLKTLSTLSCASDNAMYHVFLISLLRCDPISEHSSKEQVVFQCGGTFNEERLTRFVFSGLGIGHENHFASHLTNAIVKEPAGQSETGRKAVGATAQMNEQ